MGIGRKTVMTVVRGLYRYRVPTVPTINTLHIENTPHLKVQGRVPLYNICFSFLVGTVGTDALKPLQCMA